MRVLHLISSSGMYGAEAVILQLSKSLRAQDQATSLLMAFHHDGLPAPQLHAVMAGCAMESHLLPCKGQLDRALPGRLREWVAAAQIDVLHAHGYKADIYAYLAFRKRRCKPALVSTCHTWYDNDLAVKVYGMADRWVLRSFDRVVAVSAEVQERLRRAGVSESRTHLIENGVSIPKGVLDAAIEDGHSVGKRLRVGLVGRLAPEKGVDVFLRAAAELRQQYPQAEFVVAGEGPERATLEALLRQLGAGGGVNLLGRQEDMPALLSSLDVLVSTSRQEGLPVALLEGMAAGLPVVATRVGEVLQLVEEGVTGFLVMPDDAAGTASATGRLLRDAALRKRFGEAGRERVRSRYSAEQMTAKYLAVYRSAIGVRESRPECSKSCKGGQV